MVILSQNCSKERLICIVKLFSDAWSILDAVVEFILHLVKNRSSLLMSVPLRP